MGSDDPKHRRSYAAPPSVVLGGIFVMGITMGIFLTLLAASAVPDKGARTQASRASRGPCTSRFHFLSISLSLSRFLAVTLSHDITPCTAAYHAICASGRATLRGILHTLRGTLYTCTLLAVGIWPSARHVLQRAVRHPPGLARMTCACVLVFVCVRGGRQTRPWKPSRSFCSRAVRGLHHRHGVAGWNCDQTFGLKPSPTSLGLASTWSPARTRANPLDAACGCFCTRRLKCAYVCVLHMSCTPRAACCSPL